MNVCTIVARNYLAFARVMADSFRAHHPHARVDVLVLDAVPGSDNSGEPFRVLTPQDVGLDTREFHRMATIYDVTELATAVKPWVLRSLIAEYGAPVVYLDPDIEVFAPLDEVDTLAEEHGVVLTPHSIRPMPRDGMVPTEADIMVAGTFNLGFIAVGPRGSDFLEWWAERLRRDCINEIGDGLFVDQRWVDLAAQYFECFVLKDDTYNVAYWNLDSRTLDYDDAGVFRVNGRPLRFFHFSGFHPQNPAVLSKHQRNRPRHQPTRNPVLRQICQTYAAKLLNRGFAEAADVPYGFASSVGGVRLTKSLRRSYREELIRDEGRADSLPDAFDPRDAARFARWASMSPRMYRWLIRRGGHAARNPRRTAQRVVRRIQAHRLLSRVPASDVVRTNRRRSPIGVNLVGYLRAEDGIGQGARGFADALTVADVPFALIANEHTPSRQDHDGAATAAEPVFRVNLVCVNADEFSRYARVIAPGLPPDAYTIGVWAWEVEEFPEEMARNAALLDEIWAISRHTAAAIAPRVSKPVVVSPYPVTPPPTLHRPRAELGLPGDFLFFFSFDVRSIFERKNPLAVVTAFARAFTPGEGPVLVVKGVNGTADESGMRRLRAAAEGRTDIVIREDYVSPEDQLALMASCDCYVSLHRAEGQGLTLAEAMAAGKPVIATAYSGNVDFMTERNSYLVPYDLVPVPAGCAPYPTSARWAEPDIDVAAEVMRQVYANPADAKLRGDRARHDILSEYSAKARGAFVRARLATITRELEAKR
ncbi:MAG: glycosyltransferase family 4 protein [Actinobacteria bacterium]|nr:glycosyltransferase family 4 protein [Actinomycetota bacterium]